MSDECLTWPSDTAEIELMAIIDFEVLFNYRSFGFAGTVDRREEIFWIDFVVYLLIAGEAYASQQYWHDYKVSGMSTDNQTNFVKRAVQEIVNACQMPHL